MTITNYILECLSQFYVQPPHSRMSRMSRMIYKFLTFSHTLPDKFAREFNSNTGFSKQLTVANNDIIQNLKLTICRL